MAEEQEYVTGAVEAMIKGNELHIVGECEAQIVAVCDARRDMSLKKRSHRIAQLGLTVAQDFRGEGIGEAILTATIDSLPEYMSEVRLFKLSVFAPNTAAIALYEKLGFRQCGLLPEGVLYRGQYVDHVLMYRAAFLIKR